MLKISLANLLLKDMGEHVVLCGRPAGPFTERLSEIYERKRAEIEAEIKTLLKDEEELAKERYDEIKEALVRVKKAKFGLGSLKIKDHNDSEVFVQINTNVRGKNVDVIQSFNVGEIPKYKDELKKICNAANLAGAAEIAVYLMYTPEQREDTKVDGRVPLSAASFFEELADSCGKTRCKLSRVEAVDLHAAQAQGFIDVPIGNLMVAPFLAMYFKSDYFREKQGKKNLIVVSPDAGGAKRAEKFSELLGVDYIVMQKSRPAHGEARARAIERNLDGMDVLMIDDICDTGGSLGTAYEQLKERGARSAYAAFTFGLFTKKKETERRAEDVLREAGIKCITTDLIPRSQEYYEQNKDWLIDVLSMTAPFAEIMLANRLNFSVSELMTGHENEAKLEQVNIKPYLL